MAANETGGGWDDGGVPPLEAGELGGFVERAKWPKVLGVFSIVQGSLGLLVNACGACFLLVGMPWLEGMLRNLPKSDQPMPPGQNPLAGADTMALMRPWMAAQGVLALVTLATSVWLLVAGIQMVQRRPKSVGLHKGWAYVRMALAVLGVVVGIVSTLVTAERQAEIQVSYGGSETAMAVIVKGLVTAVVSFVLIMVYPVVVLVVLEKPWAKSEVARWKSEGDVAVDEELEFK